VLSAAKLDALTPLTAAATKNASLRIEVLTGCPVLKRAIVLSLMK